MYKIAPAQRNDSGSNTLSENYPRCPLLANTSNDHNKVTRIVDPALQDPLTNNFCLSVKQLLWPPLKHAPAANLPIRIKPHHGLPEIYEYVEQDYQVAPPRADAQRRQSFHTMSPESVAQGIPLPREV